nr:MAG TPA: hypothetical protein [Caudoviricetes sp.]
MVQSASFLHISYILSLSTQLTGFRFRLIFKGFSWFFGLLKTNYSY